MAKLTSTLLAAGALLSAASSAAAAASPKVVGFPIHREARRDVAPLSKRAKTVTVDIANEQLLYFINVTVGTPPQPFSLQLDTGSSDIWFPATSADICQQVQGGCAYGALDPQASSTFQDLGSGFQIQYVDGSQIDGHYISDVLGMGNIKIQNMTMAAATTASRGIGIMGIGYPAGESIAATNGVIYPNIINELKNQGYINTLAYSLWLNDLESNTGNILFGGIDTKKYVGDLIALPIQLDADSGNLTSFTVAFTGLSVTSAGQKSSITAQNAAYPVILDSGTTLTYLPDDLANAIFNGVGAVTDSSYGTVVPCSLATDDLTLTFTFGGAGGKDVTVGIDQLVLPFQTESGHAPRFRSGQYAGQDACQFGIDAAGQNPILFGDTFLRSAYVVYDLQNNMIGLAQTDFNATSSNVQEITNEIPNVSSTATGVQVTQTFSSIPLRTAGVTASASADLGGTARSATFKLVSATASSTKSGSTSASKTGAAPAVRAPPVQGTTVVVGLITAVCFLFGSGLMFFL